MSRPVRVLLVGYYGYGNFGDDLLLSVILRRLTRLAEVEVTVAWPSGASEYVKIWFPSVKLLDPLKQTKRFFAQFDHVLFGGGGTLFDYRAARPLPLRFRQWVGRLYRFGLARLAGTRFAGIGLGIGPFASPQSQAAALAHLKYQDFVYVRDELSLNYGKEIIGERAHLATDLSFAEYGRVRDLIRTPETGKIVIVVRHFKYGSHRDDYVDSLLQAAVALRASGKTITWVSLQQEYDAPVLARIRSLGDEVWMWNPASMTIRQTFEALADAECVVSARLHGLYVAAMLHVPCVAIDLHPKMENASRILGTSAVALSACPTPDDVINAIEHVGRHGTRYDDFDIAVHEQTVDQLMTHVEAWIAR